MEKLITLANAIEKNTLFWINEYELGNITYHNYISTYRINKKALLAIKETLFNLSCYSFDNLNNNYDEAIEYVESIITKLKYLDSEL